MLKLIDEVIKDKVLFYPLMLLLIFFAGVFIVDSYNSLYPEDDGLNVDIYLEPQEKEYVYVPLDCVVEKYFYDEFCYKESLLNG